MTEQTDYTTNKIFITTEESIKRVYMYAASTSSPSSRLQRSNNGPNNTFDAGAWLRVFALQVVHKTNWYHSYKSNNNQG